MRAESSFGRQKYNLFRNLDTATIMVMRESNAIIAGGAVRSVFAGEHISDYDLYFDSEKDLRIMQEYLDENFKKVFTSPNAISYKKDKICIQLIIMPELIGLGCDKLLEGFDFTICMGAFSMKEDRFYHNEDFLIDLSEKRLVFNIKAKYPMASMYRVLKYIKKGYKISGLEIVKISLSIHNLKMNSYKDLRKQLMGIDTLFLKELTDSLLSKDKDDLEYDFDDFMDIFNGYCYDQINVAWGTHDEII